MNALTPTEAPPPEATHADLSRRLSEAEDTLHTLRAGNVDALMIGGRIYCLSGEETAYRLLIEAMGEGACTVSGEGSVLHANRRLAELLAVPLSDLIGASLPQWVTAADRSRLEAWLAEGRTEGQHHAIGGELFFKNRNQTIVQTRVSISRLDLPGPPALGVVIVDLTEPKRAEEALRRSNRALRTISACDHALVKAVNEADLLRAICQSIVREGGYLLAWVGTAEHDTAKTIRPAAWAGTGKDYLAHLQLTWADEDRGRGPGGTAIRTGQPLVIADLATAPDFAPWKRSALAAGFASCIGLPLRIETEIWGVMCIYADHTEAFNAEEIQLLTGLTDDLAYGLKAFHIRAEHEKAEAQILRLNAELEQRVRERTVELEAANTEMEAFIYTVAHDLRAPLRSIDGFSQILLDECSERLEPVCKGHLARVRGASQHMGLLIEGMLRLSRLTRGELRRTHVDLSVLAQAVLAELQQQQPERHVSVVIAPDLVAQADPNLMQSVLENLLGNAWKFTGKTAEARIEFGRTDKAGVPTYFVHDNGAGFDMAYQGKLFGVFQRLHRNDEFPGTGVGLASVQRIIHRHHGRVWADSELGKGATFYFTLEPAPTP